ncbi:MAG TPA: AMP-dependent synthetase/ligase [Solirubrobacterales bacterium]|nr:AMP-dependent synthetase/ligase [Solirubrobacterales bacterium]
MEAATAEREANGGPGKEMSAPNLAKAFHATVDRMGSKPAVISGDQSWTWSEIRKQAAAVSGGLASLGVGKGDTVALLMDNRAEFMPTDLGVATLGGVPFSIYQTSSPEQIQYVCSDAGAKVAVVEKTYLELFMKAKEDLPDLEHVITLDGDGGTMTFEALCEIDPDFDDSAADQVDPDDLLTLIYTSGTTGPPKGVQLTHRNLMSLVSSVEDMIPFPESEDNRVISWLPAAHIAERGAHYYLPVIKGLSVTICPDPKQIIAVLPKVKPTWFFAVPRIWEKVKAGIESKLEGEEGVKKTLAQWAIGVGKQKVQAEQKQVKGEGGGPSFLVTVQYAVADRLVLSTMRENLGLNEAVAVNVGAAPTPYEVLEFFHAIGIPIGELWGMSETCGVATLNPPEKVKLGTVGPPTPGIELKLVEDGEVLVRGDSIMAGYRNMPDKTDETIDGDGWLSTGDIGELDSEGYLKIVDRKKELIINAAGKNMSPASIESEVKSASPLIGQAIAIGDNRPYNVALLTLDPEAAPAWAQKQGISGDDLADLAESSEVRKAVDAAIETANAKMSRVEQIKKFKILPTDWEPGGDELTPTMKLKRKPINEKYESEIKELYS